MDKLNVKQTNEASKAKNNTNMADDLTNNDIFDMLENTAQPNYPRQNDSSKHLRQGAFTKKFQYKNHMKKGKVANKITFSDFANFVENFIVLPSDKKYSSVFQQIELGNNNTYKDIYMHLYDLIRNKVSAVYVFKERQNIGEVEFKTNWEVNTATLNKFLDKSESIKMKNVEGFFENNNYIYEHMLQDAIQNTVLHKQIVDDLNIMKSRMEGVFKDRMNFRMYMKLYEGIHKMLKDIFVKTIMRKKKTYDEFDFETVQKYIERENEFLLEFGDITQFDDEEMVFENLFDDFKAYTDKYL